MTPGTRLGPYEIVAPIGAGGMGEVYRARDTRLDRTVAVKISAEQFSERFEREARAVAALNHPNICTLHDVGPNYLVMEYIEGPTLAERIRAGAIPLEEALPMARQIAEALEAAHEKGIVHRDLKPANIKLTADGKVKVLDFGLAAMAQASAQASGDPASSPTLTLSATRAGMILGTAGYMSPEQARGLPADKRADIWAFGVVLYEMLTGRQVFLGETVSDTLAAVLRADLDWKALPAGTPASVRRLLRRCLERDRKQRLHDIADARLELNEAPEAAAVREKSRWPLAAACVLAVALVALAAVHFRETPPVESGLQVSLLPPAKAAFTPLVPASGGIAISPDGRSLALSATQEGRAMLWIRRLDSLSARPLPGTENGAFPFWSPDNRFLAFFADNKLKKIELAGGPPQAICDAGQGRGGTWNRDGMIVFTGADRTIYRVRAAGGDPVKLTAFASAHQENAHYWPYFLPDGRHFVYYGRSSVPGKGAVCVGSIDDKPDPARRTELVKATSNAIYVPRTDPAAGAKGGWLLFLRAATLFAQKIDAGRPALEGEAVPVAENVGYVTAISLGNFSASVNGLLVYGHGTDVNTRLVWFSRDGKQSPTAAAAASYGFVRLSPDEGRLAAVITESQMGNQDIWQIDLREGVTTRFTFHPAADLSPVWSPDGKQIAFTSFRDGAAKLYLKAASGTGDEERITPPSENTQFPFDWSRDGRYLLYREIAVGTGDDLWVMENPGGPAANRKSIPFLKTAFNETQGCFSPDGRWVAYISDESSRYEVYVRSFTGAPAKFMISNGGGTHPRWRSDGRELYYVGRHGKMMAVPVKAAAGTFERGSPTELFDAHFVSSGGLVTYRYDVTRDGQRFLAAMPVEEEGTQSLSMVVHWEAGLKK